MAIPEIVRRSMNKQLIDFCLSIVPAEKSEKELLNFKIKHNRVTLFLEMPAWTEPVIKKKIIGQFRYDDDSSTWRCYLMFVNKKWDLLKELEPIHSFGEFLKGAFKNVKGAYVCRMLESTTEEFCLLNDLGSPTEI